MLKIAHNNPEHLSDLSKQSAITHLSYLRYLHRRARLRPVNSAFESGYSKVCLKEMMIGYSVVLCSIVRKYLTFAPSGAIALPGFDPTRLTRAEHLFFYRAKTPRIQPLPALFSRAEFRYCLSPLETAQRGSRNIYPRLFRQADQSQRANSPF
jgi:hypothetical protein